MKYDLSWLKRTYDSGRQPGFLFFTDMPANAVDVSGKATLAQWFPSSFRVQGDLYKHAAHWMMVQKARLFHDAETASELLALDDDDKIRNRGRQIAGFDQDYWDEHKFSVVVEGNLHKFSQDQTLRSYISKTHPLILTEANPEDRVWGIGLEQSAPGVLNPHQWQGLNLLGFALMEVRDMVGELPDIASMLI